MLDPLSHRHATELSVKRLRRFAVSMVGDQDAADKLVLGVMNSHKHLLVSGTSPAAQLLGLLKAVYQNLHSGGRKSQNLSLLNPLRSELVDTFVKFQSLEYTKKAIISLLLIEELSSEKISQITEIPFPQVDIYISQSLKFLSEGENRKLVSG